MEHPKQLRVERFSRVPYGPMLALQEARHAAVAAGEADDTLFLLEHEAVITTGRNTGDGHVLVSRAALQARGVAFFETGRGGDVTYHGPGQLVGYPILALQPDEQDVKGYVYRLEEILIRTAADFGVRAERVPGLRGIWVGNDKLAAIGVRLARWVTMHGFALNVSTELSAFDLIVPCGLHGRGVTSLARLCDPAPSREAVEARLITHAEALLGRAAYAAAATRLPPSHAPSAGAPAPGLTGVSP
jgi:lipoyl(octanoyl) transferase